MAHRSRSYDVSILVSGLEAFLGEVARVPLKFGYDLCSNDVEGKIPLRPEEDVLHFLGKYRRLMIESLSHHNIHPQRNGVIV